MPRVYANYWYGITLIAPLAIYSNHSTSSNIIGYLDINSEIGVTELVMEDVETDDSIVPLSQIWAKHSAGWSLSTIVNTSPGTPPMVIESIRLTELTSENLDQYEDLFDIEASNTEEPTVQTRTPDTLETAINRNGTNPTSKTMRLMGSPYQLNKYADHRDPDISPFIGRKYLEKITTRAPFVTIIPGHANYLSSENNGSASKEDGPVLMSMIAGNANPAALFSTFGGSADQWRYYNFKSDYTGYMGYVNLLARQMAVMLGLDYTLPVYTASGTENVALTQYDWRNYRWDATNYSSLDNFNNFFTSIGGLSGLVSTSVQSGATRILAGAAGLIDNMLVDKSYESEEEALADAFTNQKFIQFYIDPSSGGTESFGNETGTSKMSQVFDGYKSTFKEMAFIANSGGLSTEGLENFVSESVGDLQETLSTTFGSSGLVGFINAFTSSAANVVRGENVVIPDVYTGSTHNAEKSFDMVFETPYKHPLAVYLDVLVPIAFWLALVAPANKTSNSYDSPFLIKAYYDGVWSCNLGIVKGITISKQDASWTADGLPNKVKISVQIEDLYDDLSINSLASGSIEMFLHNSSLIEFLMTQCGLSLVAANFDMKQKMRWNVATSFVTDRVTDVSGHIGENLLGNIINIFSGVL